MEPLIGLYGCVILLGIPIAVVVVFAKLHRRLGRLETQVGTLDRRVAALSGLPARPAGASQAPAPEPLRMPLSGSEPEIAQQPAPEPDPEAPRVETEERAAESVPDVVRSPPEIDTEPWWTGLEEKIWTRLPVWLGAIALALAAAYLVKFSLDRGWISPAVRVAAGLLGGVALLVGGDRLRRSSDYVAQGLAAAGIGALFVSFWAATDLYELVPWWLGLFLMALTTATAVLLSLRQGYLIAVLGLVGGFLTPALVSSDSTRPWALFSYLLLLQIGLVVVSRRRAWGSLGVLTLGGGFLWLFAFLGGPFSSADSVWVGLFLLASVSTFCFQYLRTPGKADGDGTRAELGGVSVAQLIGWGAFGGGLVAASALAFQAGFGLMEWGVMALLAAGCFALARLDESYHALAWLATLVVTFQLASWQSHLDAARIGHFLGVHVTLGVLMAGCAWLFARGMGTEKGTKLPGTWAALATSIGVVHLLLLVNAESVLGLEDFRWGVVAAILGAVFVVGCVPFARARHTILGAEKPLAAMAVGATVLFSLALPLELERQWLTVSWALEVMALLWLSGRLKVEVLRYFAWLLAAGIALRLLLNPAVLTYTIGTTPVLNWLLYGYGMPIGAFLVAARLAQQQNDRRLAETLRWLAGGLFFAFVTLQIRQYFFPGDLDANDSLFLEWATYLVAWSAMALGSVLWSQSRPVPTLVWGGRILAALSVVMGSSMLGLGFNPALRHEYVGEMPLVNGLLWGYGVPAVFLFLILRLLRRQEPSEFRKGDGLLAGLLSVALLVDVFTLVTLEVRQAFHAASEGGFLDRGSVSTPENYAYSIAWIVLGVTLALIGRRSTMMRWGSLCVLLPATLKVFLYDTSELEGLWRVASLVGLGISLMALAYFFQRFVFQRATGRRRGS